MYNRKIKYTDYNGNEREKEVRFNITTAELIEMETSKDGGYDQYIARIANNQSAPEIFKAFKELVTKSYGEKSDDGESFIKIDPITGRPFCEKFEQTAAYAQLMKELVTDTDAASEFINSIFPADAHAVIEAAKAEKNAPTLVEDK